MKYYLDGCEVSQKLFDLFLTLESNFYNEKDADKYIQEQKEQLIKYGKQYNSLFKISYEIKKD